MNTSEAINELAAALAKAQGEIQNPAKNHTNPHYRTRYADLTDGLDVIRPTLSRHGLAFVQATEVDGDMLMLRTRLLHTSGQFIDAVYPVCRVGKHQEMGSALTYAKRYCLFSLVGVAGDDDDDGNTAGNGAPPPARKPEPPQNTVGRKLAEAYAAKAMVDIAETDSADRLGVWWKAEAKNRALHFDNGAHADLLKDIRDAAAERGKELAEPAKEAAQ